MREFNEMLEDLLKARKMSQRDLAKSAGLTDAYISHFIKGIRKNPSQEKVEALANALQLEGDIRVQFFEAARRTPDVSLAVSSKEEDHEALPRISSFWGRERELFLLEQQIVDKHCGLVGIVGMGGMGKTALAAKIAERIHQQKDDNGTSKRFEHVLWYSLHNAPLLTDLLRHWVQILSQQEHRSLQGSISNQIESLIAYLKKFRCLLILDNFESVMQEGEHAGSYREGYGAYGELLQLVGQRNHKSCLLFTSREKPKELSRLEGQDNQVHSLQLTGIGQDGGRKLLEERGLSGSEMSWGKLIQRYSGNPLALKLVAEPIREIFEGKIDPFLAGGEFVFGDINDLLEQQFERLSALERDVMYWLAIEREAVPINTIYGNIVRPLVEGDLYSATESLVKRSMVENIGEGLFTLQPVITEYVTDRLINTISSEIASEALEGLSKYALIKAQSKEYIRTSQIRFILDSVAKYLLNTFGLLESEEKLKRILSALRDTSPQQPGYAGGNILNLLIHLGCNLRGYNFSYTTIRQAYLQDTALPEVDFSYADLRSSVFTNTFGSILSVALSVDGSLLAAGTADGEIIVWRANDTTPVFTLRGHKDEVRSVAFSSNGNLLASGSEDQTVRVWDVNTGDCFRTFTGHEDIVRSVAFNHDGKLLASSSEDLTIRIWNVNSGQCRSTLQGAEGHVNWIRSIAFSPDGKLLASGSDDHTVRVWDTSTSHCLHILQGHTNIVRSVAFSPDGKLLASAGNDQVIRVWDPHLGVILQELKEYSNIIRSITFSPDGKLLASGGDDQTVRIWKLASKDTTILKVLEGHTSRVWSVTFSPDGQFLVSGSEDQTVRFWSVPDGDCLKILRGYSNRIWSVAFSPDGKSLASGNDDQLVRIWDVNNGLCTHVFEGHTRRVRSVNFSPDRSTVVSGSEDETVRLWDVSTKQCQNILNGHTHLVRSVAFNPDSNLIVSGSHDTTVRLWNVIPGVCLKILKEHLGLVWSVAFSPDGTLLASASDDYTVRLWDIKDLKNVKDTKDPKSVKCVNVLRGHTHRVWSAAFSPDGTLLASASDDYTVRLWDVNTGKCLSVLEGHTYWVRAVAFSPNGTLLASASHDKTVRLWDINSKRCISVIRGHTSPIWSMAFNCDGDIIACCDDETIKLWKIPTGDCLRDLRVEKPYENMNIVGVRGLSEQQKVSLKALGAIDIH